MATTLSLPPIAILATAAADLVLQAAEANSPRVNAIKKAACTCTAASKSHLVEIIEQAQIRTIPIDKAKRPGRRGLLPTSLFAHTNQRGMSEYTFEGRICAVLGPKSTLKRRLSEGDSVYDREAAA